MSIRTLAVTSLAAMSTLGLVLAGPATAATDTTPPQARLNAGMVFEVHSILGDTTPNPLIGPVGITFTASDNTGITSLDALAFVYDKDQTEVGRYETNDDTALREIGPTIALNGHVDTTVTAYDAAGNMAVDTATYSTKFLQQNAFALTGRWFGGTRATWSGSTVVSTRKPGSAATYTFTGRSIAIIGNYGPDRGTLTVSWGNGSQSVDTAGPFSPRAVIFAHRFGGAGSHTITVTATSTSRVDLDGLITQN